ncbi:hypothetical protein QVG61_07860 [Thiohalobacter sp. IOR34]|uniref:hypothetical protein n=1 Tax=Thiohalobacter sp. IOR34 TaxID=3057176 RepID=UPI0025AF25E8|nr:hypothetical protein [Thiohalobacter sp. IOR34]WJW74432.1 hypothetical protein QVG61_07860 [Thiohalobacter sp. IOR34]
MSWKKPLPVLLLMLACGRPGTTPAATAAPDYAALPANRWVVIHTETGRWRRQEHAGAAYDSHRGTLLLFGSNTHGKNWDNSVREFDPQRLRWTRHYPPSPRDSYRLDAAGHPVAGPADNPRPWAMHSYDGLVYDPGSDSLIVAAAANHHPLRRRFEIRRQPVWRYDLTSHRWQPFDRHQGKMPTFFDAATAYDSWRRLPLLYKFGIWELDRGSEQWRKATGKHHHNSHFNLVYDSLHQVFAAFGSARLTNSVWLYHPGKAAGEAGRWEERQPGGDPCPPDQHIPVAFHPEQGVFVLVVDDNQVYRRPNGRLRLRSKAKSSGTYVYDLDSNRYRRLPQADLPAQGMNYMLVYASRQKVLLLVTGDWRRPPSVRALRLDLGALPE